MYWQDDFAWWGWLMMSLGMVVFWGLLAWGALLLLRGRDQTAPADRRPGPKEILDERLARGEIRTQSSTGSGLQPWGGSTDRPRPSVPGVSLAACSGRSRGTVTRVHHLARQAGCNVRSDRGAARVGTQGIGLSFISLSHGAGNPPPLQRAAGVCSCARSPAMRPTGVVASDLMIPQRMEF